MSDELPAPIEGQALIYATADGTVRVEVLLGDETFWLTINRMAELFGTTKQTISYHLRQIYDSGELSRDATVKGIVTVQLPVETGKVVELDALAREYNASLESA